MKNVRTEEFQESEVAEPEEFDDVEMPPEKETREPTRVIEK